MVIVCILLVCACVYDYRDRRIPNWVIGLLLVTACVVKVHLMSMLIQMLGVMALFYAFFKIGVLGAGDVKLLAVCAGFLPAEKILLFLFISLLIAAIISLCKLMQEQNIRERFKYLFEYIVGVMQKGAWQLYIENEEERRAKGICMSGPILCSILLYFGGVY